VHFQRDYMKVLQFHCQGTFLISQKNNNKRTLLPIKGIIFRKSSPSLSMYIIKLILVLKIWNKIECTNLDMYFNMMAKNLSLKLSYMHSYEDKFFQRNNYFFLQKYTNCYFNNTLKLKKLPTKKFQPIFVFKFWNSRIFQLATKM
jgi:hypothetical protein